MVFTYYWAGRARGTQAMNTKFRLGIFSLLPLFLTQVLPVLLVLLSATAVSAKEISSSARVNEDGSLHIKGKTVHLYGIHIPKTGRTCRSNQLPPLCGSRAVIALEFKIDGFVRCEIMAENNDRSVVGWCRVNAGYFSEGEDLSAYLLERGWAVALPDAPFEYQTMEKISRHRGVGVWGIPIDGQLSRD
jgi:endonuclease YncB( thermonuclease family)